MRTKLSYPALGCAENSIIRWYILYISSCTAHTWKLKCRFLFEHCLFISASIYTTNWITQNCTFLGYTNDTYTCTIIIQ